MNSQLKVMIIGILWVLLCVLLFSSCNHIERKEGTPMSAIAKENTNANSSLSLTEIAKTGGNPFKEFTLTKVYVVNYDGCDYIVVTEHTLDSRGGASVALLHSESCKNPIHNNNIQNE